MRPVVVSVGPLASASANAIALSQTPTKGALTLNGALATGGVVTMDTPRQVLITTTGNETSRTFTITGTNASNDPITEVITGVNNSTVASVLTYNTVTSIVISGNAANALTVGTNGIADSPWVRVDEWSEEVVAVQAIASGTVNYTVQYSLDDPNSPTNAVAPSAMTWTNIADLSLVAATGSAVAFTPFPPLWIKTTLNSGTGSVRTTFSQPGGIQ